jgi:hypothetical protein
LQGRTTAAEQALSKAESAQAASTAEFAAAFERAMGEQQIAVAEYRTKAEQTAEANEK